jgi:hypothetical protein
MAPANRTVGLERSSDTWEESACRADSALEKGMKL